MFATRSSVGLGVRRVGTHLAVALACAAMVAVTFVASPAGGMGDTSLGPATPSPALPSELLVTGLPPALTGVGGWLVEGPGPDLSVPYPTSRPADSEWFPVDSAGIIAAAPPGGGTPLQLYCTQLQEATTTGYGYDLGEWSTTPNAGQVARILNDYYPSVPGVPANGPGITNDADRALVVQSAIWYFTDNFVVNHSDAHFSAVQAVVDAVRQNPLPAPATPEVELAPSTLTGTLGTVLGPVTLSATDGGPISATVTITGGTMYSDAAGTVEIASGSLLPSGSSIYVRSASVGSVALRAVAEVTVPGGSAYVYNGNIPGVTEAQNLILATTATVEASGTASLDFTAPPTTVPSTTAPPTTPTSSPTSSSTTSSVPVTTVPPVTVPPAPPTPAPPTTAVVDPRAAGSTGASPDVAAGNTSNGAAARIMFTG